MVSRATISLHAPIYFTAIGPEPITSFKMKIPPLLVLAFCFFQTIGHAQHYKGLFFGLNSSQILNDERFTGGRLGWQLGFAFYGDAVRKSTLQMEFMVSSEGGSSSKLGQRAALWFAKMPLLVSLKVAENSPWRFVLGLQPSLYLGGFARNKKPVYRPRLFQDDPNRYKQEELAILLPNNFQANPKHLNIEPAIGFELLKKKVNYGLRASVAAISESRFQTANISLRIGF